MSETTISDFKKKIEDFRTTFIGKYVVILGAGYHPDFFERVKTALESMDIPYLIIQARVGH
jgi:hypothetical protein